MSGATGTGIALSTPAAMRNIKLLLGTLLVAAPLVGCSVTRGGPSPLSPSDPPSEPYSERAAPGDNFVHVPQASLKFLTVEAVEGRENSLTIRVPARAAFRDGALSEVGPPLAGRVVTVRVKSGDHVRIGEPLVTLACPEGATARTALATARASLKEARAALDRETRMIEEGVGTEREKLEAELRFASAQSEVDRAQATSSIIGAGEGAEVVVRSPIAGSVLTIKASSGAAVEPGGEPLVEIGDPSALWIVADVSERELPLVREGTGALVELSSVPALLRARVVSVGTAVSNGLRTAPVRIELEEKPAGLRPGMFGRVRIESAAVGPTLPTEAVLIKDGKDSVVYVAKDALTFERRAVVVGQSIEGRVQVISGLSRGERVVVRGALLLDGAAEQLL
ncbi:MAG: efflux RND transporter periplasmic adaptor subunit [Acidobacteria bacterium]|nr:MAG: efflux RND transporter periplasmic adaptor subunit [Acidobacteriota bacterium]